MKNPLNQAIALALGTAAFAAGGISTASARVTTMYNLFNNGCVYNQAGGPNTCFGPLDDPQTTDGWVYGGISSSTDNNPSNPAPGWPKWAGTDNLNATPFGYKGGAILNWAIHMTDSGLGEISKADSEKYPGVSADIDAAKGAWSDAGKTDQFGWRHDLDFGLFRSNVAGTVTLSVKGVLLTGTDYGFTIFRGMDTGTNYNHHGSWNNKNNRNGITAFSVPGGGSSFRAPDVVAYSVGGPPPNEPNGPPAQNLNKITFHADAGQIYTIVMGGYRNGGWESTNDGYILTAALCQDGTFCENGKLTADHAKQLASFTSDGTTPVTIKTTSYASGGFDPLLTLFDQWGKFVANVQPNGYLNEDADNGGPCNLAQPDPSTGKCYDAQYTGVLPAGKYWVALTQSSNVVATDRIEAFSWDGRPNQSGELFKCSNNQFCDDTGANRTGNWNLQILGAQNAKLEPAFVGPTNTAPEFVGGTTSLNVRRDSSLPLNENLHAKDPDAGQTLVYALASGPAHGTVSISADATVATPGNDLAPGGTITYTPAPGYLGPDRFSIRVRDGSCPPPPPPPPGGAAPTPTCNDSAVRNFTVSVNNLPGINGTPFTGDDGKQLFSFTADGTSEVTLKTSSYAAGGFDPLLTLFDAFGKFVAAVQPNGYLNDDADNGGPCSLAQPDPATGLCLDAQYKGVLPAGKYWVVLTQSSNVVAKDRIEAFGWDGYPNQSGELFKCSNNQFCDSAGNNRSSFWNLEILGASGSQSEDTFVPASNTPPVFVGGATSFTIARNTALDLAQNARVSDPDAGQTIVYSAARAPANGTLAIAGNATVQAPGTSLAPPAGSIVYTPRTGFIGTDTLTLRASDGSCAAPPPPPPGGTAPAPTCVDSGDRTYTVTVLNHLPPTANAGSPQTTVSGTLVTLDGSKSSDPEGTPLKYRWTQTAGPTVALSDAANPKPSFIAPSVAAQTALSFQLVVTDSDPADPKSSDAATVDVTVLPVNARFPVAMPAVAYRDAATVVLDGSASTGAGQPIARYEWTQVKVGNEPTVSLVPDPSNPARVSFAAPRIDGVLSFQLRVSTNPNANPANAADWSEPALVSVTVSRANLPPEAQASATGGLAARAGSLKTLDGSGSFDPEGAALTYRWRQSAGPAVTLSSTNGQKPTFTPPFGAAGQTLRFGLVVSDGVNDSPESFVGIQVTNDNRPPVVSVLASPVLEGSDVVVNSQVSDPDGDAFGVLWEQVSGPAVSFLGSLSEPSLRFTAPPAGTGPLVFRLTATDQFTPNPLTGSNVGTVTVNRDPSRINCVSAAANRTSLWPADTSMQQIRIVGVQSPASFGITVNAVTSDEPVKDKPARDRTGPDARIRRGNQRPLPIDTVMIRAERQKKQRNGAGSGNGRVYEVRFTASTGSQSCTGSVQVQVPMQKGGTATDDGQNFNALSRN
jgi:hypothetical protein